MSLIDDFMEDFIFLNKVSVRDEYGSFTVEYQDGATFSAALVKDTSMQARIAEQAKTASVYTLTFDKALQLEYHDVIKRKKDGKKYRLTSDPKDTGTPKSASFSFQQATLEVFE